MAKMEMIGLLLLWILCSKLVKSMAHSLRCPRDVVFLPVYIASRYYHSLLPLWALFTMGHNAWGTRVGVDGLAGGRIGAASSDLFSLALSYFLGREMMLI